MRLVRRENEDQEVPRMQRRLGQAQGDRFERRAPREHAHRLQGGGEDAEVDGFVEDKAPEQVAQAREAEEVERNRQIKFAP